MCRSLKWPEACIPDEAYKKVCKFARLLGKRIIPVIESPGIISTRLIAPMINEACEILMEGVADMEDIDATMKIGYGFPYGPFEMADKIGIDVVVRWLDNLYKEFGDIKYKASPMLKKRVRANHLGRDTGIGFYRYDEEGKRIPMEIKEPMLINCLYKIILMKILVINSGSSSIKYQLFDMEKTTVLAKELLKKSECKVLF
jgi:3-hydroxyacyl-CoA dehydrogenase